MYNKLKQLHNKFNNMSITILILNNKNFLF